MSTKINVRSPKVISATGTVGEVISIELYIWNHPAPQPTVPNFTLEKPIPSSIITEAHFDISPYIRQFINHTSFTPSGSDSAMSVDEYAFCHVDIYRDGVLLLASATYDFIAFDGFGYHAEGYNPADSAFLTDGTYFVEPGSDCGSVYYHDDQSLTWQAKYTDLSTGAVTSVTLAEEAGRVPYLHSGSLLTGNKLEMIQDGVVQNTYIFKIQEECKYTPVICDFVNKFGVWQRTVFFKNSTESFNVSGKDYNLMNEAIDYDIQRASKKRFNLNGNESINVNTGFVPEEYSEVLKQLLFSETVLINDKPAILDTKSIDVMTSLNDKNINYSLKFTFANSILNYNI